MLRALPVILFVATAFAGCLQVPAAVDDPADGVPGVLVPPVPDFDFSTVVDPDHASHQVRDLHLGGHGLALTGHTAIQGVVPSSHRASITQVDVWEGYALVSGMEDGLGFAIVDIADPASPKVLSWVATAARGWTARFSDDGQYVFYGCQMLPMERYPATSNVKGDCKDPEAVHPPETPQTGVVVVDVKDKAKPVFVDFLPTTRAHNLYVVSIDGVDTVFTDGVDIVQLDRAAGKLLLVANLPGVHDAAAARHPVTRDWLLFTGTNELSIYRINDPAAPELLYEGPEEKQFVGWHEQTLVPALVDGRVVLVLAGETRQSTGGVPDSVTFMDVTDPTRPAILSTWKPPFDSAVPWTSYLYSAHEIAATPTGQVAIAWYHAGVWVLDVSTRERQEAPVTLAAYLPTEPLSAVPSTFQQTPVPYVPFVWGVGWDARGYLVVPDMHTGLYVLEPEWGLHPAVDSGQ